MLAVKYVLANRWRVFQLLKILLTGIFVRWRTELGDEPRIATRVFAIARPEEVDCSSEEGSLQKGYAKKDSGRLGGDMVQGWTMNISALLVSATELYFCWPPEVRFVLQKESDILWKMFRDSVLQQNLLVDILFFLFFFFQNNSAFFQSKSTFFSAQSITLFNYNIKCINWSVKESYFELPAKMVTFSLVFVCLAQNK